MSPTIAYVVYAVKETFIKKVPTLECSEQRRVGNEFPSADVDVGVRSLSILLLLLHRLYVQHSIYIHTCSMCVYFLLQYAQSTRQVEFGKTRLKLHVLPASCCRSCCPCVNANNSHQLTSYCYLSVSIASRLVVTISLSLCVCPGINPKVYFMAYFPLV